MSIAWGDLLAAGFGFESLIEHPAYPEILSSDRSALVDAAIVAYSRPFSHSEGLGQDWPDYAREDWKKEHKALMEYRHTFVGHSDPDPRTVTIESDESVRGWSSRVDLPMIYMPGRAEMALEMCRDLHVRLNDHLDQAIGELIRRERDGAPSDAPVKVMLPRS
jgi:hypothetical protein